MTLQRTEQQQNNCHNLRQAVKLNYNCNIYTSSARAYTHSHTASFICPQTFVQCHTNFHPPIEYSLWVSPMRYFRIMMSGSLCGKWATESGSDRKRETGGSRRKGAATASVSTESSGTSCIFIKTRFHLSCEPKCGYVKEKKKNTHTAALVKYAAFFQCSVDLWKGWMSYLIEYPKCQSRSYWRGQKKREGGEVGEKTEIKYLNFNGKTHS